MRVTSPRLSLILLALAASVAAAQAQNPDPHHSGGSTEGASPRADMQMPNAAARGGQPGAMGADMDRMMETMHPMMADHCGTGMPFEHVEGRIAYLKAELKITSPQATAWDAFAETMRADATAMKTMHDGMMQNGMPMTTPDRMAARHKMMSARTGMMEHSEASTKALYAVLSEDQRKIFDQIMSGPMGTM